MEETHLSPFFLEWRIQNFSCWMKAAHGESIKCCESTHDGVCPFYNPNEIRLSLYPGGEDGDGELIEVTYVGPNILFREKGELSFVGPDGFLLCTRRLKEVIGGKPNRVAGPKFQDVVSRIEQNVDLHGDHLTLQFRCEKPWKHRIYVRTTLDVLNTKLQITLPNPLHGVSSDLILASVPYHDGKNDLEARMLVTYFRFGKEIHLNTINAKRSVSVKCHASVFDRSKVLVTQKKIQETFTLFKFASRRFSVLDSTSALDSGGHAILQLKIINGSYRSHSHNFFQSTSPLENASKNITLLKSNSSFSLGEDLRCLYEDREFSNFQLKCGTVSFPVHRNVLRARSPVFRAMLTKEAATGSVDIEDLDVPTLDLFLTFLYTGSFKDVPCDEALKLYYAADKYQVPSLKTECVEFLCANVCISNVCDILSLGDRYEDEQLTSAAQNFILKAFKKVLGSKEWQDYGKTDPQLLLKTVNHFAAKGYLDISL